MTLSDISIRRPVFAWMLMAGLLVFGALSYLGMGISQLPDVDFPVVTVRLTWAGAPPDVMENSVADPVENAVMSVDGAQLVQSISQQGQTQVIIQFGLDKDINVALQEVQTKLSQAQRNLPQTVDPPIITKTNPNDQPIIYTAAYSETGASLRDVAMFVRDHLQDRITTVKGVGDINLGGYVDPQMRIWLDPKKMNARQISVQDIEAAVNNQHQLVATGYHVEFSGSSQAFAESFRSLIVALVLGIFVAYMVLATQFNSFLHPVIILLALPFSITGALLAMKLTGTSVNIYSLIGILLLMGIVKKNSILLVEFTNRQRHEGKNVTDALLTACPVRLRPILMTSVATIAGAIPEAFAAGSGAETIRPMAIAVIGGVMVSTLLTLIVVPCAYSLASRLEGTRHAQMLAEAEHELKAVDGEEEREERKSA